MSEVQPQEVRFKSVRSHPLDSLVSSPVGTPRTASGSLEKQEQGDPILKQKSR